MKRIKLILSLLLVNFLVVSAKQVSEQDALKKVQDFYAQKSGLTSGALRVKQSLDFKLVYTCTDATSSSPMKVRGSSSAATSTPYFYVFNNQNGFVIVSADDATKSILAYSDEAPFGVDSIPENIKSWLDVYKSEIAYTIARGLTDSTISSTAASRVKQSSKSAIVVAPLLGTIKWNQGSPYNLLCPPGTPTGCVATAMAQVMKYHQWPLTGTGTHAYLHPNFGRLEANFGTTNYNWANLTPTYGATSTAVQDTAIATLMYHCGVSVDMNYTTTGSGAFTSDVGYALVDYFGYDPDIQVLSRSNFSYSDWKSTLKTELDALRPIIYWGRTSSGGHAFVCDGYDTDELFHINWGWGGSSNGYFELSSLNPSVQGIGGYTGGYSQGQGALLGIRTPDGVSNPDGLLCMYSKSLTTSVSSISNTSTTTFTAQFGYENLSLTDFSGYLGVGLYLNGVFQNVLRQDVNPQFIQGGNVSSTYSLGGISLAGIADGNYQICAIYRGQNNANWTLLPHSSTLRNYVNVVISGRSATFTFPATKPVLTLTQPIIVNTVNKVFINKQCRVKFTVQNSGTEFYSTLAVRLQQNDSTSQYINSGVVCIPAGATSTFEVSSLVTLPTGLATLSILSDSTNNNNYGTTRLKLLAPLANNPMQLMIDPTPTAAIFSTSNSIIEKTTVASSESNKITTTINNTGGCFVGSLAVVYTLSTNLAQTLVVGQQNVGIDTNSPQTLNFEGALTLGLGTYTTSLCYLNGSIWSRIVNLGNVTITRPTLTSTNPIGNLAKTDGSQISVNVTSNTTWTAVSNSNWLTVDNPKATGNGVLSFTAKANSTGVARTASIKLSASGAFDKTFNITQDGDINAALSVAPQVYFTLYPNPTNDVLNVILNTNILEIEVLDLAGRVLLKNVNTSSISTKSLLAGIYVIKIKTADTVYKERFVRK